MEEDNALQNNTNDNVPQGVMEPQMQQPAVEGVSVGASGSEQKSKWGIVIGCLVGVIVIVAVVLALVLGNGAGGGVSMEKVRAYCNSHNLEITEGTLEEEPKGNYIMCDASDNELAGAPAEYITITFAEYEKPVAENEKFAETYEFMKSIGVVLEESDEYKKIYLGSVETGVGQGVTYLVIGDKTYASVMASSNEMAKEALIGMGYSDRNWGTDEELKATSADLQIAQRDTQRRDDMASLSSALTQYQANNRGQLPEGPSYYEGQAYIECTGANVACGFVMSYLNQTDDSTTNEFINPIGEPYNLYITNNWVDDGDIDLTYDENEGLVAVDGDGYTVAENEGRQDTAYVVVGGKCDGTSVVKSEAPRKYAVLLDLEGDGAYCVDNN